TTGEYAVRAQGDAERKYASNHLPGVGRQAADGHELVLVGEAEGPVGEVLGDHLKLVGRGIHLEFVFPGNDHVRGREFQAEGEGSDPGGNAAEEGRELTVPPDLLGEDEARGERRAGRHAPE